MPCRAAIVHRRRLGLTHAPAGRHWVTRLTRIRDQPGVTTADHHRVREPVDERCHEPRAQPPRGGRTLPAQLIATRNPVPASKAHPPIVTPPPAHRAEHSIGAAIAGCAKRVGAARIDGSRVGSSAPWGGADDSWAGVIVRRRRGRRRRCRWRAGLGRRGRGRSAWLSVITFSGPTLVFVLHECWPHLGW